MTTTDTTADADADTNDKPSKFEALGTKLRRLIKKIEASFVANEDASVLLQRCDEILLAMMAQTHGDCAQTDTTNAFLVQIQSYRRHNDRHLLVHGTTTCDDATEEPPSMASPRNTGIRGKMGQQQEQLRRQNERLQNARRTMQETSQLSEEIMEELGRNRETMEASSGKIQGLREMSGNAKTMVDKLMRKWF
mmetsp:Transcript_6848/g.18598  ORF Transcript_6848/g.18598 Transcript_6848/m.18598 type:complete len:193 (-) Transcript_6848:704-1282(-)